MNFKLFFRKYESTSHRVNCVLFSCLVYSLNHVVKLFNTEGFLENSELLSEVDLSLCTS